MPEHFRECSTMQKSADSLESADSLRGNRDLPSVQEYSTELQQEIQIIDEELEQELKDLPSPYITENNLQSFIKKNYNSDPNLVKISQKFLQEQNLFGIEVTKVKLRNKIDSELSKSENISMADRITVFKESLSNQGKSSSEILDLLISKFEHEKSVETWVENWKKFLRLHEIAQTKSPRERKVISNIIGSADFTSETAFETSLDAITNSSEISEQTKLEISLEFDGSAVSSIDELDSGLRYMRSRKTEIESAIDTRNDLKESLNSDILALKDELEKMSLSDPKRDDLEKEIADKKAVLLQTQSDIRRLEMEKPTDVSYVLREGFTVKMNPDGSRNIAVNSAFSFQLPTNRLPFMGTKNLRCINLAFACAPLLKHSISQEVFVPNLENGSVPTKSQRDMGHLILASLGFNDLKILTEKEVVQLGSDLGRLTKSGGVRSGQECLIDLGIYDPISGSLDKERFTKALLFIRENRNVRNEVFFGRLEKYLKESL